MQELVQVLANLLDSRTSGGWLADYLQIRYPALMESLARAPAWVGMWLELQSSGGWERVSKRKNKRSLMLDNREWEFWKAGTDLNNFIGLHRQDAEPRSEPQQAVVENVASQNVANRALSKSKAEEKEGAEACEALSALGLDFLVNNVADIADDELEAIVARGIDDSESEPEPDDDTEGNDTVTQTGPTAKEAAEDRHCFLDFFDLKELPRIPTSKRSTDELLSVLETGSSAWDFSMFERRQLVGELESEAMKALDEDSIASFQHLARRHREARVKLQEANDNVSVRFRCADHQIRVSILAKIDLVGATTNGEPSRQSL